MRSLSRKTALVTGAWRGIGRATALALATAGAQVVVHYGRGAKEAEAVVAEIRKAGGRADAVGADLSAPDGAHKLARQVRAVVGDRLDILVANAGISKAATIEETTVEDFDKLFAVDTLVKHFASVLGERGIRVNAVAPGVVATDMSSFTKTDAGRSAALGMQALKRIAQPDDIGSVIVFLVSDDARWITGDTVRVDGGSKL